MVLIIMKITIRGFRWWWGRVVWLWIRFRMKWSWWKYLFGRKYIFFVRLGCLILWGFRCLLYKIFPSWKFRWGWGVFWVWFLVFLSFAVLLAWLLKNRGRRGIWGKFWCILLKFLFCCSYKFYKGLLLMGIMKYLWLRR